MLALALGGRSVAEWQAVITPAEFQAWIEVYRLAPFDDYHRFHRPAALVARAMGGGEMQPLLDWLQPDRASEGMSDADVATMRAFGFTRKGGQDG